MSDDTHRKIYGLDVIFHSDKTDKLDLIKQILEEINGYDDEKLLEYIDIIDYHKYIENGGNKEDAYL